MSEVLLRRLGLDDVEEMALVHRTSFDERLPWLRGLRTPDEDRWFLHGGEPLHPGVVRLRYAVGRAWLGTRHGSDRTTWAR